MSSPNSRDGSLPVPISLTVYNRLAPGLELGSSSLALAGKDKQGLDETVGSSSTATSATSSSKKWFRPDYTANLLVSVRLEIFLKTECGGDDEEEEKIIYSSTIHQSAIHPVWDHLNERVPFDHDDTDGGEWETQSGTTFARIILVNENDPNGSSGTVIVKSVPLNPHALRRLPKVVDEDSYSKPPAPSSLPPNAVLVRYSDGLVRVQPSLYHILLEHGVIQERDPRDLSLLHDDDEEDKHRSRFDDDVFDILGKVDAPGKPLTGANASTSTSLVGTSDQELSTPVRSGASFAIDMDNLDFPSIPIPATEDEADVHDLQLEHDELLAQIEENERLLQAEEEALQLQAEYLQLTMKTAIDLEEETKLIRSATAEVMSDMEQVDFTVALHKRRLVKDLQQIYPVTNKNQDRYWIANAELPLDLFRGQVHEDEISAALGYLAHCLVMMSKYLNVALRHKIVCNSSRSAIQDADGTILPLFLSRVAERQQLERGLVLLHRSVDCLSQSQGLVVASNEAHILAKLSNVYDKVISG